MPVRTCAACRGKGERHELFRFVLESAADRTAVAFEEEEARAARGAPERTAAVERGKESSGVLLDLEGRLPGRGVYCHRQARCLGTPLLLEVLGSQLRKRNAPTEGGRRGKVRSRGKPAAGENAAAEMQQLLVRTIAEQEARWEGRTRSKKAQAGLEALRKVQKELASGAAPGASGKKVRFRL